MTDINIFLNNTPEIKEHFLIDKKLSSEDEIVLDSSIGRIKVNLNKDLCEFWLDLFKEEIYLKRSINDNKLKKIRFINSNKACCKCDFVLKEIDKILKYKDLLNLFGIYGFNFLNESIFFNLFYHDYYLKINDERNCDVTFDNFISKINEIDSHIKYISNTFKGIL